MNSPMPSSGLPLVLVVDDDPDLRKLISEFLAAHGFRVATAENSTAMRQFMRGTVPDLVILDVMMPGEDGLSAARYLAAEHNRVAIIMLSALGGDTEHIIGLRRKLNDRADSELIRTVRNEGYMLLPKVVRT